MAVRSFSWFEICGPSGLALLAICASACSSSLPHAEKDKEKEKESESEEALAQKQTNHPSIGRQQTKRNHPQKNNKRLKIGGAVEN